MAIQTTPNEALAQQSLPAPLRRAIEATFADGLKGCALVGGTALAGYFAGHRTSDDMDLFTADATAQKMAVAAIKSLTKIGAVLSDERTTPTMYHALAQLEQHRFTVDIVLDENLHKLGSFVSTSSGILLADPKTLLKMKVATLVSRCSEKDLYDLVWLTENYRNPNAKELVELGRSIDAGVNAEAMLIALVAAESRESACGFALKFGVSNQDVLRRINTFKIGLCDRLADYLQQSSADLALAPLLRKLKKLRT